jgi:hypothetical protein
MERTANGGRLPVALVATIVAAIVLAAASPLLAIPLAPALIVTGALSVRRSSDPLARALAWGALVAGLTLLALIALVLVGFVATTAGEVVVESSMGVVETPSPAPSLGP